MKREYVVQLLTKVLNNQQMAEMVVDLLQEESLLHLGYGDADIDMVVDTFTDAFGTTKVSKYDRFAARRLVAKYGGQAICGIIRLLAENSEEKFAPVVGSVSQLEDKIVAVLRFLRSIQTDEEVDLDQ